MLVPDRSGEGGGGALLRPNIRNRHVGGDTPVETIGCPLPRTGGGGLGRGEGLAFGDMFSGTLDPNDQNRNTDTGREKPSTTGVHSQEKMLRASSLKSRLNLNAVYP